MEAYKQVKTDKRLVIAGDSSDTDDYAVALKEAAASDPARSLPATLRATCSPSCTPTRIATRSLRREGLPMSLLEAMSHGAACVTSDIPECADVLQGCGLTFPHGDAGAARRA
ncbi:MAG: glycosyltransferase family 4 protein [Collinsella sp.]